MERTVNKAEIGGYIGADPKITTFEDGRQVVKLVVATEESFKDRGGEWKQETTWHTIIAWSGKEMPPFVELRKGQRISVQGKIKNKSFEGRDGQMRYFHEILAFSIKMDTETGGACLPDAVREED